MSSDLICIEGAIGAGKSSFAKRLAIDLKANLFLEKFEENSFLPKFYANKDRYAFALEMSFLADRYHQIQQFEQFDDEKITISDYYITKSRVFASVNLCGNEAELFDTVYKIMFRKVWKPRLLVYLYRPVKQLISNIELRGRPYESKVEPAYLNELQTRYLEFIETQKDELTILILDIGDRDFIRDEKCYRSMLETIGKRRLKGLYRETI